MTEDERGHRRGLVLVGVLALALVAAFGFAVLAFTRSWIEFSGLGGDALAADAAHRVDVVMMTGALDAPDGAVRQIMLECDEGSGEPGITVILFTGLGRPPDLTQLTDRWTGAGWQLREASAGTSRYSRQFGDWTANLYLRPLPGNDLSWTAGLLVSADMGADCDAFSDDLEPVLRKDQARVATEPAAVG